MLKLALMSFLKKVSLQAIILVVVFFFGFLTCKINSPDIVDDDQIIRKNFNHKFINPILECNPDINQNNNLSSLKNTVEETINNEINKKNISFASVYFRDLNNGPWFGINETKYFSPASLIKVPILITYLKKAETDPTILDKKIINPLVQENGAPIQNIKPSETLKSNQEYTIRELLEHMIIYSDNNAYNDLVTNLSSDDLMRIYKDLDIDISKAVDDPNGNILTVKDYASFYRILFNASYLDQDMSEKALEILSRTDYKKALVAGIPNNIPISHKFGERKFADTGEIQFHDCGIIYYPQNPYLLCVMTKTNNLDHANTTIQKISQMVYQKISQD